MSNRDGKNAKRRKGDKISLAKAGDPCPNCAKIEGKRKKTKRKVKLDADRHAIYVYSKITRLSHAYCSKRKGHEGHVHCEGCHWTNF